MCFTPLLQERTTQQLLLNRTEQNLTEATYCTQVSVHFSVPIVLSLVPAGSIMDGWHDGEGILLASCFEQPSAGHDLLSVRSKFIMFLI